MQIAPLAPDEDAGVVERVEEKVKPAVSVEMLNGSEVVSNRLDYATAGRD